MATWRNSILEPQTTTTTGFPPLHNGFDGLNHDLAWNKSLNHLEDFCQTAQANDNDNASFGSSPNNPYQNSQQFDPNQPYSTSHLSLDDMDMDMMGTSPSFNTSFDSSLSSMSASASPSVGATWSESSPEYLAEETCRRHESANNNDNNNGSFHRPSTMETTSNNGSVRNDAQSQSFSPAPMSDASWGSSPAPVQVCVESFSFPLVFVSVSVSVLFSPIPSPDTSSTSFLCSSVRDKQNQHRTCY